MKQDRLIDLIQTGQLVERIVMIIGISRIPGVLHYVRKRLHYVGWRRLARGRGRSE